MQRIPARWRESVGRALRQRMAVHERLDAVADAMQRGPALGAVRRPACARADRVPGRRHRLARRGRPRPPAGARVALRRAAAGGAARRRGRGRVAAGLAGWSRVQAHRRGGGAGELTGRRLRALWLVCCRGGSVWPPANGITDGVSLFGPGRRARAGAARSHGRGAPGADIAPGAPGCRWMPRGVSNASRRPRGFDTPLLASAGPGAMVVGQANAHPRRCRLDCAIAGTPRCEAHSTLRRRLTPCSPQPTTGAGYSGTPLVRKLGFKPGMRVHYANAPEHFDALVGELPDGVTRAQAPGGRRSTWRCSSSPSAPRSRAAWRRCSPSSSPPG